MWGVGVLTASREPQKTRDEIFDLICDIVGLLQESKRPLPRKPPKKSDKGFPGPLGLGVEKAQKSRKRRVENEPKT